MLRCHRKYPRYKFDQHKGYGTREHMRLILRLGPSPLHRRSFYPVSAHRCIEVP
jgi:ribonuclease HII